MNQPAGSSSNHSLQSTIWTGEELDILNPRIIMPSANLEGLSPLVKRKHKYLNKHYLPPGWKSEGIEEFPVILPYEGEIPEYLVSTQMKHTGYHPATGVHNFTYDHINTRYWEDLSLLIKIAMHYECVIGLDFSPLVNARRCEVVEAIRRSRTATAGLQVCGLKVIQSASFGHPKFNKFMFDGLASNAPTAIEHIRNSKDRKQRKNFRLGVEALVEKKQPSILLVYGFPLDFDPGVPVKYYPCHIQKLRAL